MKTYTLNGLQFQVNDDDDQYELPDGAEVVASKQAAPKNKARQPRDKKASEGDASTADGE